MNLAAFPRWRLRPGRCLRPSVLLILLGACSRSNSAKPDGSASLQTAEAFDASTSLTIDADTAVPARPVTRPDCSEPLRLTQLGTMKKPLTFEGDLLVEEVNADDRIVKGKVAYDPETFAAQPRIPIPEPAPLPNRRHHTFR